MSRYYKHTPPPPPPPPLQSPTVIHVSGSDRKILHVDIRLEVVLHREAYPTASVELREIRSGSCLVGYH